MSAVMEIVDDAREFFAPVSSDVVDGLIGQYQSMRRKIERMAAVVNGEEYAGALAHFAAGNKIEGRHVSIDRMFDLPGAIASLNAESWQQAMNMTDVYSAMPQKRRDEWNEQIRKMTAPDFEEATVRSTLLDLMMSRQKFFAERVDGIFRALSGEHVTNAPEAFGKRMILANITNGWYSTERAGYINDLRCVIAKFMGRDEPKHGATEPVIKAARQRHGEWINVDGGALRIRCYLKGTAHLEVHPDMAWRLNCVLASLHPTAIPAKFRQKPVKKAKEFQMIRRPLPFAVVDVLAAMKQAGKFIKQEDNWRQPYRHENIKNALAYGHHGLPDKHVLAEVRNVLVSIGGVWSDEGWHEFDYDPTEVMAEIVCSGCIPDQKSHQFYPTPENVGAAAIEMADIGESDECCEPSAGQGDLAALMPKERTTCVEISPLHCAILKARGFSTIEADFLAWAETAPKFDCIVMNPPFSEGRAKAHVEAAATLIKAGGRLVAILPASFKGKDILPGWNLDWSRVFENEFAGTSVSVVICRATRLPTNPIFAAVAQDCFAIAQLEVL